MKDFTNMNILIKEFPSTVVFISFIIIPKTYAIMTPTQTSEKTINLKRYNITPNDNIRTNDKITDSLKNDTNEWLFKDYLRKFRPINVWDRLYQKKKAQGVNATVEKNFEELIQGIDETDEILRVKLETDPSGRRTKWSPPGRLDHSSNRKDPFSVRRRIYELILHTLYWTRNKMIIMQTYRKKYKNSKLYKMGFMMSKNDIACKMFHRFSFRAMSTCLNQYYETQYRFFPIDVLHAEERMLNKWMDIKLLTDLIERNDETCREMLEETNRNREQAWIFYD